VGDREIELISMHSSILPVAAALTVQSVLSHPGGMRTIAVWSNRGELGLSLILGVVESYRVWCQFAGRYIDNEHGFRAVGGFDEVQL
jgi:hypothetical protein